MFKGVVNVLNESIGRTGGSLFPDPTPTFVMGPETLGLCPCPEMEPLGDCAVRDLKGVMLWETPDASVNCSRSSTLVRPLAAKTRRHEVSGGGDR